MKIFDISNPIIKTLLTKLGTITPHFNMQEQYPDSASEQYYIENSFLPPSNNHLRFPHITTNANFSKLTPNGNELIGGGDAVLNFSAEQQQLVNEVLADPNEFNERVVRRITQLMLKYNIDNEVDSDSLLSFGDTPEFVVKVEGNEDRNIPATVEEIINIVENLPLSSKKLLYMNLYQIALAEVELVVSTSANIFNDGSDIWNIKNIEEIWQKPEWDILQGINEDSLFSAGALRLLTRIHRCLNVSKPVKEELGKILKNCSNLCKDSVAIVTHQQRVKGFIEELKVLDETYLNNSFRANDLRTQYLPRRNQIFDEIKSICKLNDEEFKMFKIMATPVKFINELNEVNSNIINTSNPSTKGTYIAQRNALVAQLRTQCDYSDEEINLFTQKMVSNNCKYSANETQMKNWQGNDVSFEISNEGFVKTKGSYKVITSINSGRKIYFCTHRGDEHQLLSEQFKQNANYVTYKQGKNNAKVFESLIGAKYKSSQSSSAWERFAHGYRGSLFKNTAKIDENHQRDVAILEQGKTQIRAQYERIFTRSR